MSPSTIWEFQVFLCQQVVNSPSPLAAFPQENPPIGTPATARFALQAPGLRYFQSVWEKSQFTDCFSRRARQYTNTIQRTSFISSLLMFDATVSFPFLQLLFFLLCSNSPSVKIGVQVDQIQGTRPHLAFATAMPVLEPGRCSSVWLWPWDEEEEQLEG